jgi:predicted  nucleic acid-binding Zn-ribbon protein
VQAARRAVEETERELARLRAEQRDQELEIRSVRAKLKQNQDRLYSGRVRNPKELSNLQDEATALRRRLDALEESQLELMIDRDDQQALLDGRREHLETLESAWREEQSGLVVEQQELVAELATLQKMRENQAATIGWEALDVYEDLRARLGGVAVALVKEEVCQACGVAMSFSRAKRVYDGQELVQCGACNRLLFGRR